MYFEIVVLSFFYVLALAVLLTYLLYYRVLHNFYDKEKIIALLDNFCFLRGPCMLLQSFG